MTKQRLSMVFFGAAVSVPFLAATLNAILSQGPGPGPGEVVVGPTSIVRVSGTFVWRFFQWHAFGSNNKHQ